MADHGDGGTLTGTPVVLPGFNGDSWTYTSPPTYAISTLYPGSEGTMIPDFINDGGSEIEDPTETYFPQAPNELIFPDAP